VDIRVIRGNATSPRANLTLKLEEEVPTPTEEAATRATRGNAALKLEEEAPIPTEEAAIRVTRENATCKLTIATAAIEAMPAEEDQARGGHHEGRK
jgi:hypothetical protein